MKVIRKTDGYEPSQFLKRAYDCFYDSETLFAFESKASIGYLQHLGVELIFKAWLLEIDGKFPTTHSLSKLLNLLKKVDPKLVALNKYQEEINDLDRCFELRYPPACYEYDQSVDLFSLLEKIESFYPNKLKEYHGGGDGYFCTPPDYS